MSSDTQIIFITGFPGVISREVAILLSEIEDAEVRLLASTENWAEAEEFAGQVDGNISIIKGSEGQIDFGLSGEDYLSLSNEVTAILHLVLPGPLGGPVRRPSARVMAREVIELGLAATRLSHIVVLSQLDVVGTSAGIFAERDLELGQSFSDLSGEDRFRSEKIYRRFVSSLPITVARAGWIMGDGNGLCPLVDLLLALDDQSSLPTKDTGSKLFAVDAPALVRIFAGLAQSKPVEGAQTLHLVFSNMPPILELFETVQRAAKEISPQGFELAVGARRMLKRNRTGEIWSVKEFFKRQPYRARISTSLTERFLSEQDLTISSLDNELVERLVAKAVEKIVGFR
ncbi:MAG: hypothetical protein GY847_20595 [Proteobacteria bacterium]|nr:hypothetical protein [Pseudomonadota bacterium]